MTALAEGWWFPLNATSCRYMRPRPGDHMPSSLCRRWGAYTTIDRLDLVVDDGVSRDDCKACRRKLDAERAKVVRE